MLLLVAIIAAIALTLRARKDTKHIDPSEQVKAKKADRVRIVSMKPKAFRATCQRCRQAVRERR